MIPIWKQLRLSLEKPYDEPVLYDITHDGEHIYETKDTPAKVLTENLRRIFLERGHDFFDRHDEQMIQNGLLSSEANVVEQENQDVEASNASKAIMTTEELFKMRKEILPQLFIALGEMTLARDLLASFLSVLPSSAPLQSLSQPVLNPPPSGPPAGSLTASIVSKPQSIISSQAFNAQLVVGGKDEALRKAADIFKAAAKSMDGNRARTEQYWIDALRIRRANWGLVPAPLPFGSPVGKGADKTAKDFLISYGLEESPPLFKRQAVGRMASTEDSEQGLIFPYRRKTRLSVTMSTKDSTGTQITCRNVAQTRDDDSVEQMLRAAQAEIVEREIFSLLVKEAGILPTVSARVSERLIALDAVQGTELRFELVDNDSSLPSTSNDATLQAMCDLVRHLLHALLLRRHAFLKSQRLSGKPIDATTQGPLLLGPIIDLLQYQTFCQRVKEELDRTTQGLQKIGVSSSLRFNPVCEIGKELVSLFSEDNRRSICGEAVLRLEDTHTIRLTLSAPSLLTAHLAQATLGISSIRQLYQLLRDEVERFLLQEICELGKRLCADLGAIWFVDLNKCVGRWELCVLNFQIVFQADGAINCSVYTLNKHTQKQGTIEHFPPKSNESLFSWVEHVIHSGIGS